jgi:Family of unknown function (DUF6335)
MRTDSITLGLDIEPYQDASDAAVSIDSGRYELRQRMQRTTNATPLLAGGDLDAQWDMAESTGDETAGASTSTPDQNVTQEWGDAIGISYGASEPLRCGEKQRDRDLHRWELNPASAEDYRDRVLSAPRTMARLRRLSSRARLFCEQNPQT